MCLVASCKTGSIVPANFPSACSQRGSTVVTSIDGNLRGLETILEICANRCHKYNKLIFIGRLYANLCRHTYFDRTYIQRRATAVRWDEAFVALYHLNYHFPEQFFGNRCHHDAISRTANALGILFQSENPDFAIFAAECFQSLENFLTIVQTCSCHVNIYILAVGNNRLAPFSVLVCGTDIIIGWNVSKSDVCPINICFVCHYEIIF